MTNYYAIIDKISSGPRDPAPWGVLRVEIDDAEKTLTVYLATENEPRWRERPEALRFVGEGDDSSRAIALDRVMAEAFVSSWKERA